jgi:hypothetical protein
MMIENLLYVVMGYYISVSGIGMALHHLWNQRQEDKTLHVQRNKNNLSSSSTPS